MDKKSDERIPEHHAGVQTNTESSTELDNTDQAIQLYHTARSRLLNVNQWHELAGSASAQFQLMNAQGNAVQRTAQKGDYFRIDIPGPGNQSGEGDDWVQIESIEEGNKNGEDFTAITVRPSSPPVNDSENVAHFFSEESTSTFMVRRADKKVIAGVYGRNEKPNTETNNIIDKIRNLVIASGAISGFSKVQWKSLVKGMVTPRP